MTDKKKRPRCSVCGGPAEVVLTTQPRGCAPTSAWFCYLHGTREDLPRSEHGQPVLVGP
jgi:hypothetical protein